MSLAKLELCHVVIMQWQNYTLFIIFCCWLVKYKWGGQIWQQQNKYCNRLIGIPWRSAPNWWFVPANFGHMVLLLVRQEKPGPHNIGRTTPARDFLILILQGQCTAVGRPNSKQPVCKIVMESKCPEIGGSKCPIANVRRASVRRANVRN